MRKITWVVGDRVFERISLPIVKFPPFIPPLSRGDKGGCEAKPSEAPKAFGAENERKYSVSNGHTRKLCK